MAMVERLAVLGLTILLCHSTFPSTLYANKATTEEIETRAGETKENASLENSRLQTAIEEDFCAWKEQCEKGDQPRKFVETTKPVRRLL